MENGQMMGGRSFSMADALDSTIFWQMLKQSLAGVPNPTETALERAILIQSTPSEIGPFSTEQMSQELGLAHCEIREYTDEWASALLRCYLGNEGISLNLMMPLLRQRADEKRQRRKQQARRLIPLAAVLGLVVANVGAQYLNESVGSRVEGLRQADTRAKNQQRQIKSLQKEHEGLGKQIAELAWGERQFPPLAERLLQVSESIPKTVRLTEIKTLAVPRSTKKRATFDPRETLRLVGRASSQEDIEAFRVGLLTTGDFDEIRQVKTEPIIVQGEKWLEFTLSLTNRAETVE